MNNGYTMQFLSKNINSGGDDDVGRYHDNYSGIVSTSIALSKY